MGISWSFTQGTDVYISLQPLLLDVLWTDVYQVNLSYNIYDYICFIPNDLPLNYIDVGDFSK